MLAAAASERYSNCTPCTAAYCRAQPIGGSSGACEPVLQAGAASVLQTLDSCLELLHSFGRTSEAMFRTAEEALQFFGGGEWAFSRSLCYRLGGGVGTVAGRAQWKPWPYPLPADAVTSVDATPLPDRDRLLLYDEVRCTSLCAARTMSRAQR